MDPPDPNGATWPSQLTEVLHRDMYPLLDPSNPELSAAGKRVLVTGATGAIGRAIAEAWAIAGASAIVLTGRRPDALQEVAAKLRTLAPGQSSSSLRVAVRPADLRSEADVRALWAFAADGADGAGGPVDVLVNNAGQLNEGPVAGGETEDWWSQFEVNVKGVYLMSNYFMRQAPASGTIITLGSSITSGIFPDMSSYTMSKFAVGKLMEFIHVENPDVRAFTLFPGIIDGGMTPMQYRALASDDPMLSGGASLFLCTPRAEWMRGCILSVNWDIEEMEAHREEIERDALNKMAFLNAKTGKGGHPWSG
ncbi:NAD(P)-binding protein [Xylariaceae sp. FL0804]|nr:NAD(P)-binding protein [Xylariaceae sp. FL0804]